MQRRKSNQSSVVQAIQVSSSPDKVKKSKSKKTKYQAPVVVVLDSLLEECTRFVDVVEYLDFNNIRSLSCTNKSILNDITTMPAIDSIWRNFLYSDIIDEWKEYQIKIEKEKRDLVEKHFGCRKIALAIKSNTCSSCGSFTTNLDLITCSRACWSCWMCKDSGPRGTDSNSPFALCALGYAKTHYLISDSEIAKNLLVWQVNDPDRCHGLVNEKIKVVNEKKVKEFAIKKFDSIDGLAQEKTARSLKSEQKWIQKCNTAKANGKAAPAMPDQIRKEREKEHPQHTNFVCINQRFAKLNENSERYGYHKYIYGTRHIIDIQPLSLPTAIVTDATDEELKLMYEGYEVTRYMPPLPVSNQSSEVESETVVVDKEDESNNSSVVVPNEASSKTVHVPSRSLQPKLVIYTNLVDAVCEACRSVNLFSKIVIDKNCNLPDMIAASSNDLKKYIIRGGNTIADTEQANTLYLCLAIKFEGTENCSITSNNAIFWTVSSEREHYHFKNLKMVVQASNRYVDGNLNL